MRAIIRSFEFAIALGGLFFMSGTLTSYLTPLDAESAPLVQAIGGSLGLFAVLSLLFTRDAIAQILTQYWPAILPVLFAIISIVWTEDAALTLRRAGSLSLTTAFAFWLAFRFTPLQIFRLLLLMAITVVLINYAFIQSNPSRGIHQSYDLVGASHAGSWRGLFGHKNDFGRLIALVASLLVLGFVFGSGLRYLRWLVLPLLGLVGLLLLRANSSQAVLLAVAVPAMIAVVLSMRHMSPTGRSLVLIVALPFAITSALSAQLIFEYVLELLGRDATLTGRTIIWEGVIIALGSNVVLGGGYGAGWEFVGPQLTALTGADVGHAHNGYLDLAVDVGIVGLGLTLVFMFWLGTIAFRNLMRGQTPELSAVALLVVIFSLIGNVAGSFLLLHNDLYWILLVATFAKLKSASQTYVLQKPQTGNWSAFDTVQSRP